MISYIENDNKFNYRVGAIIIDNTKKNILINKKNDFSDWWVLPGGRVELMENSKEAIVRELKEELGVDINLKRLLLLSESFFKIRDRIYHEIGLYYLCEIEGDISIYNNREQFYGVEGESDLFNWIEIDKLDTINFEPDFLKQIIKNIPNEIIHIISNEL